MAFLWGCTTGPDHEANARNGTSGYTGTDGGGPDLGGGGGPDLGDDGPDVGSWDMGGGGPEIPAPEDNCQVLGEDAVGDPVAPFKKQNGFWDQGSSEACGYYALLNANIASGANDAGGVFEAALRACLLKRGVDQAALDDGISGEERMKIASCKEEKMKADGKPVTITNHSLIGAEPKFNDLCQQIATALEGGGSAVLNLIDDQVVDGHALRIIGVECDEDEETSTVTLSDPNDPVGPNDDPPGDQYEIVLDCDDLVDAVMPAHDWLKGGFGAISVYIEARKPPEPPAGGGD